MYAPRDIKAKSGQPICILVPGQLFKLPETVPILQELPAFYFFLGLGGTEQKICLPNPPHV